MRPGGAQPAVQNLLNEGEIQWGAYFKHEVHQEYIFQPKYPDAVLYLCFINIPGRNREARR